MVTPLMSLSGWTTSFPSRSALVSERKNDSVVFSADTCFETYLVQAVEGSG